MATVIEKHQHPFAAAKAAGREPYKVKELSLADFGPAETVQRQATARWDSNYGQLAHDDSNGRAHRDTDRTRRRRALGLVQHLLDSGSRSPRPGRRATRNRGHAGKPEGHAGVRVERRNAGGILVVHERSARMARRERPPVDGGRWTPRARGRAPHA